MTEPSVLSVPGVEGFLGATEPEVTAGQPPEARTEEMAAGRLKTESVTRHVVILASGWLWRPVALSLSPLSLSTSLGRRAKTSPGPGAR